MVQSNARESVDNFLQHFVRHSRISVDGPPLRIHKAAIRTSVFVLFCDVNMSGAKPTHSLAEFARPAGEPGRLAHSG